MKAYLTTAFFSLILIGKITFKIVWFIVVFFIKMVWRILNNSSIGNSTIDYDKQQRERDLVDYKDQRGKYSNDTRWYD